MPFAKIVRGPIYLAVFIIIACAYLMGGDGVSFAATVDLPKTGQTTCYNDDGTGIDCSGTGQDGEIQAGVAWPNPRFTDNGDGTITDKLTGLMWLKDASCIRDKNWIVGIRAVTDFNSNPGNYSCDEYTATYDDWVLPNINEIESLINAGEANPAIWLNGQGFANVQTSNYKYYWSSTSSVSPNSYRYLTNMFDGSIEKDSMYELWFIWPVRTGQIGTVSLPETGQTISYEPGDDGDLQRGVHWPHGSSRFIDNNDGTITDSLTGLMWLKDVQCFRHETWQDAFNSITDLNANPGSYTCGGYTATHDDWVLPNIKELLNLFGLYGWTALGSPFENVESAQYWSSTTLANFPTSAWTSTMNVGGSGHYSKDPLGVPQPHVLPVRGGIGIPTVVTATPSSITTNSAAGGGNVTAKGRTAVTASGCCWNASANPTTSNSKTSDGTGIGSFTSSITGLSPGTVYHVRAYATNTAGTAYGSDVTFTTLALPSCSECTDIPVILTGITFGSDTNCECSDATSITIGAGVTIESGANIIFKAPTVTVNPGFRAKPGSSVQIKQ
jgi:hypothetical protein